MPHLAASSQQQHASSHHDLEYPLRHKHDGKKFLLWLILLPAVIVTCLTHFFAGLLFSPLSTQAVYISLAHFLALLLFLWFFWLPIQLAMLKLWDWFENFALLVRTVVLIVAVRALFPHDLVREFLGEKNAAPLIQVGYEVGFALILGAYCLLSWLNNSRKAFGDVRRAATPESRSRSNRWLWFDAFSIFFVLFAVVVIELYFLATLSVGDFTRTPYDRFKMKNREAEALKEGAQVGLALRRTNAQADSMRTALKADTLALSLHLPAKTARAFAQALQDSDAVALSADSLVVLVSKSSRQKLLAQLAQGEGATEKARQKHRMIELAWLCCGMLSGLAFFLLSCLPNRLMHATLIPVTFHERDMRGVIFKSYRYLAHFARAMLLKNPLLMLGGLLITIIFMITPALLTGAARWYHLSLISQADEIILALAVFLSWFIPLALAVVTPDDTFGEYFNNRLADHLMMIQGHLVFIGHGDLGKRVLDREINRFEALAQRPALKLSAKIPHALLQARLALQIRYYEARSSVLAVGLKRPLAAYLSDPQPKSWRIRKLQPVLRKLDRIQMKYDKNRRRNYKKAFIEIVTPDLRLEKMCSRAVVIERNLKDVVYSSTHTLLGDYGVVGSCRKDFKSKDARGNTIHPEKRLLVPILRGEAREPFISSRVNLERASLVISMVPDEESVQAVFERANKANVSSIICISRSDQISYLTYRSRHRPIVLVYPKENQGITLGERLWAAMQKVRAVRNLEKEQWPKVLVVGNNKANHYMLERLWAYLPGDHAQRCRLLQENFAFIVTEAQVDQAHPILKDADTPSGFDQSYPAAYVTSARLPYPAADFLEAAFIQAQARAVNTADIGALEACLKERKPDILMINHEDVEKSLLMLSRCARALERIKTSRPAAFRLPLLLLAAARGDDWERRSLGDASRYYDSICKLHREDLATDLSYPEHAHYDHLLNEQIGESIIDALADVEEIIAGARTTLQDPLKPPPSPKEVGFPEAPTKPKFIEVNGCLPNRAGALASYLAELSGVSFQPESAEQAQRYWQNILKESPAQDGARAEEISAYFPSFQYLRDITLDPEREGFALSGYATLTPLAALSESLASKPRLVARVFANDGRRYAERELDPDLAAFLVEPKLVDDKLQKLEEPLAPGVPQVLARVTNRAADEPTKVGDFHKVLLDQQADDTLGHNACPGMSICRIAAFQDYVVASNNLRLHRLQQKEPEAPEQRLWHARNYACCAEALREPAGKEAPTEAHAARIFCCCNGKDQPGMIAMVLNTLLFRSGFKRELATGNEETDWVINIDYFKGISCQNASFSLNRLFGFFEKKPEAFEPLQEVPFQLLRVLPIGSLESARGWYYYVRALHRFLNRAAEKSEGEASAAAPRFDFYWIDEKRRQRQQADPPTFEAQRSNFPVALVLKLKRADDKTAQEKEKLCELCRVQPREYDCRKQRVWV